MQPGSAPIGFEGIFSNQPQTHIGFEQFETEQRTHMAPVYPLNNTMPHPNQPLQNNFYHSNNSSSISNTMPSSPHSSRHNTSSHSSTRKSLSYPQLFAIFNEIVNEWSKEEWLTFNDTHTETYLTLDSNKNEFLTVQMAINQRYLTSGTTSLRSQPECLLIETQTKSNTLFSPNSIISLENLCDNNIAQKSVLYKLMAIVCHSMKTNSKLMFYKDFQSNSWYIYYDQSISSPSHSNILSNEEQFQLESFIQPDDHIDLTQFQSPLSSLFNHPIIYVYIPEKKK